LSAPTRIDPPPRKKSPLLLVGLAAACGLGVAFFVGRQPEPSPAPLFARDRYELQAPHAGWTADEHRQWLEKADLALRTQHRDGDCSFFLVHVQPVGDPGSMTATSVIEQLKKDWQARLPACRFLDEQRPTIRVAGQPAERLAAVVGDRQREVLVIVHQDAVFQLTCESAQSRFDSVRGDFEAVIARWQLK
jgi:hypothetical protein